MASTEFTAHRDTNGTSATLIGRIEDDWRHLVASRRFGNRLRQWAAEDPRLAFPDGDALLAATQRTEATDWHHRDRVLTALLERVETDPLAARAALQVVLPGIKHLIAGVRGWDLEERTSRVVTEALDVLDRCARTDAGTAPHFRVFTNTRRRVLRAAQQERTDPVSPMAHLPQLVDSSHDEDVRVRELDELVEWIATRGGVGERAAREVVLTRTGEVDVDELARILGVSAHTLRKRRSRTEQRLQRSLSMGR